MNRIGKILAAVLGRSNSRASAPPRRVTNLTRGTELANRLEVANQSAGRARGLLGRDGLAPGQGLWLLPCEGVHTFGMRFAIDLVYLDRRLRVRKVRHAVRSWRISFCLTARSVLELPAGAARASQTQRGDQLEIVPVEPEALPAGSALS